EAIRFYAECADKYSGDLFPTRDSSLGMLIAEPYGVIAAITHLPQIGPRSRQGSRLSQAGGDTCRKVSHLPLQMADKRIDQ
ncbi:hypothetical protein HZD82_26855, partial [Pantoea agglomerans]|uniref:hypothetical protein n=1 Tax=Enterobacter agglomerans TaxID=549 RepID=UPI001A90B5FB